MSQPVILCLDDEKIVTDTLITQLTNAFGEDFYFEAASEVDEAWEILEELEAEGAALGLGHQRLAHAPVQGRCLSGRSQCPLV